MTRKDVLIAEFKRGKVSRRDVNAALLGVGMTAAAATALVESTIAEAEAAEPVRGGRLRVAANQSEAGDTLDPTKIKSSIDIARDQLLFSRLVDFFPDEGLVPNLAVAWEPNADATQWVFEVIQGSEFSNGKTLTSADVAYSFNRHLDPELASPANAFLGDVDSITTDTDKYVVFNMKQANADIPHLLTEYHFTVQPEGQDAQAYVEGNVVSSGPFMVQEFEPGIGSLFVRNPNYHKDGKPLLDEIDMFGIPDPGARVNSLIAGDADLVFTVLPDLIRQIEESDSARLLSQPGGAHPTFPMLADVAPYTDNNVRMALKHAVDRERLLELAFGGQGVVARDHPVPPFDPFWCEEVPQPTADPDKVKFYLNKAGATNTEFELVSSDANFGGANAAVVMAELMRENGANVSVKKVPSDGYWSAVWMKVPWCGVSWFGRPTANMMLSLAYLTGASWNESHWSNPTFDKLVLESRGVVDIGKRMELYCEMETILATEGSTIIPIFMNWLDGYSPRVRNLKGHPFMYGGSMYWDDVWLDDSAA